MKKILYCTFLFSVGACTISSIKEVSGTYTTSKNEIISAKLKLDGKTIKEVELDESYNETTKKQLGASYNMKEASTIGKEWYEQVNFLEGYIEKHGINGITLDENGKAVNADILTGCTISIDEFLKAIRNADEDL